MTLLKSVVDFCIKDSALDFQNLRRPSMKKPKNDLNDQSLPITDVVFDNFAGFLNIYKKNWYFSEHTKKEIRKGLQM